MSESPVTTTKVRTADALSRTFQVRHERCDTCVFRLKYPKDTRDRLFGDVAAHDSYVSCHKYTVEDEETGEEIPSPICCAGFYARDPYANPLMRIAAMTGCVEYVDDDGQPVACPLPQGMKMAGYGRDE